MTTDSNAARTPLARLRQARRQLLDTGEVNDGLLAPGLRSSWQRSMQFGLTPVGRAAGAPHASGAQLARSLEQQRELMSHARPVMEYLFDQTRDSDGMVILADGQGMLLHALGDASFVDRAERVALRPGAIWHEQWRGTNGIGTALADAAAVVVHAGEHFLERNGFLTCTAAPIVDPAGRVMGVLDFSSEQRCYHPHTLALVRSAARMIEHRLFETHHAGSLLLRLHVHPEGIGTVTEGLLALSDEGWLLGANQAALSLLGLSYSAIGCCALDSLLQLDMQTICNWLRAPAIAPRPLPRPGGGQLWLRAEAGRTLRASSRPTISIEIPADALSQIDTGDATMKAAVARARRLLDKPIALILHGESGVGKEVFARAVHASSKRSSQPFVAVNCAALPETLIEAELFGYRPGAFTGAGRDGAPGRIREAQGGTLFLDEIGDMPLAMQTRLLRVLQDRQVLPLGGGKPVEVDFRLVCATHRDLHIEMANGRLREDLYYRLNGLTMQLPALRDRQDKMALIQRMLQQLLPARELQIDAELLRAILNYRWPGNLRQLNNALNTACALIDDAELTISWGHLSDDLVRDLRSTEAKPAGLGMAELADLRSQTERSVKQTVQACSGNLSEAARRLGISRNTLYRKLDEFELR